jgi:phosphomannomutase
MFGEEYTLVAVSDYVLSNVKGATVSNMSSSKALKDVTLQNGCSYSSAMVGEVNVVEEMKRTGAVIGGEGNGGVIYPALHYGRDALAGIALFLTHLAKSKLTCSQLRQKYPDYFMAKKKLEISRPVDLILLASRLKEVFPEAATDTRDGIKIDLPTGWIQIRKSNTEPIIRVYSEERSMELAENLAERAIDIVKNL